MISHNDPTIAWFIDRDRERRKFLKIISRESSERIMTIQAESGMGKTWLINNFRYECNSRRFPYAIIDFSARSSGYSYLEILRALRDFLGTQNFNDFTAVVNQYYIRPNLFISPTDAPSSSSVSISSSLRESTVNNVAGRDIIRDNNFFFTQPDIPSDYLRSELTASFKGCLKAMLNTLPSRHLIIWLFDSFEKIDPTTREWLLEEFLQEIKRQAFENLVVVLAGKEVPLFQLDWKFIASQHVLAAWTLDDYKEYLGKKEMCLDPGRILALHRNYSGRPLDLALWVDAASPTDDDEDMP